MERNAAIADRAHEVPTWALQADAGSRHDRQRGQHDWQIVDRALRTIAQRRAGLDAEEARWLREAEALQIWKRLSMVSAQDYMERVLGYAPRTAKDRLRVARALGTLPQLSAALASGELAYSAVRELTRVAIGETEADWLDRARGRNLREVEELVADHRLGDRPDDPKDPSARTHVMRLELSADTFALLRQARQVLDDEHGASLSEDQLVAQLCNAVLDGAAPGTPTGRAKFQVALTVCERCQQGWQHGAGAKVPIGAAAVERAMCDAQHLGSIDGDVPARAYQDISPSVARFVWHRDAGRCRVPGCRSSRGLELHHLVHRADGGGHDASNISLLCSACHQSHHAGTLQIPGTAHQLSVGRRARPHHRAPTGQVANSGAHVGTGHAHDDGSAYAPMMQGTGTGTNEATTIVRPGDCARDESSAGATIDDVPNSGARGATTIPADAALEQSGERAPTGPVANAGAHVSTTAAPTERRDLLAGGRRTQGASATSAMASGLSDLCDEASVALKQLGWRPATAQVAVRAAVSELGAGATLERVLVAALRRCPLPHGTVSSVSHRDDGA